MAAAFDDSTSGRRLALPFAPGERLEYSISFGPLHVGSGSMLLARADSVDGAPTYHATFQLSGGTFFFHVNDRIDSWFNVETLTSRRFTQSIHEGRYRAERVYEFLPGEARYVKGTDTVPSVADPLDDASFLYFVRTLSLNVGARYEFSRYFQPEGNPIGLAVLRSESVSVPAGQFDAIVVQPLIKTSGIFSQRGRAEVWIRADGGHEVLQVKSHLAFGSINLYLKRVLRDSTSS